MQIIASKYRYGTDPREGFLAVPELDRDKCSVPQYINLEKLEIELTRPTAFLCISGFSLSPSENGIHRPKTGNFLPAIRCGSVMGTHSWIRTFKNPEHLVKVDTLSGTCAAGLQALYEADLLLESGQVEEVIIIGSERITEETLRLFRESRIDLTCGDGFAYVRLEKGDQITDVTWNFQYEGNPFFFTPETIARSVPKYPVDYVKLHGSGTKVNTAAEAPLANLAPTIEYKSKIGHTQGISCLLETLMLIDDDDYKGRIFVAANGFGGFYGGFSLWK